MSVINTKKRVGQFTDETFYSNHGYYDSVKRQISKMGVVS